MDRDTPTGSRRWLKALSRAGAERTRWRASYLASILIHLSVLLLWRDSSLPASPKAAAGPRNADNRAASGSMQVLRVRTPPPIPVVRPVIPIPVEVVVESMLLDEEFVLEPPSVEGDLAVAEGDAGIAEGDGDGDGGDANEGLFRMESPEAHGLLLPPPYDRGFKADIEVWVWVGADGGVVPDSTRLSPPTEDSDFNRRMIEEANKWSFTPGRREGNPVASWFIYSITIGG